MIGPPDCMECETCPDPAALPHAVLMIRDDRAAVEFAHLVECFDDLIDDPHPKSVGLAMMFRHATHWIACARFQNYPEAKDNGYAVLMLPRSHWSKEEFRETAMDYLGPDPGHVRLVVDRVTIAFRA